MKHLRRLEIRTNPLLAVDIALLLMEEAIEAFGYADDSDGDIGVMAEEALELVGEIAEESRDLDVEQRQRVFEKLMERSDGEILRAGMNSALDCCESVPALPMLKL
ncbi:hypothetical protein HMSSN036_80220 [Paenibacillus macerans]|nr:hypothetical protein HMSSN036_80220 [Paenibacillus macerans]